MKEEHKKIVKNIIMEDYDLRPSIAEVVLECLINSCERIKEEDDIARYNPSRTTATCQSVEFVQNSTLSDGIEINYIRK